MKKNRFLLVLGIIFSVMTTPQAKGAAMTIEEGKKVSFDYTLKVEGEVVDTSKGRGPLEYVHGQGQIIPGLAKELIGLKVGDEKVVEVSPEEAYGEVRKDAFRDVPKASLPKDVEPKVGMMLQMQGPGGQAVPVKISEVKEDAVVMDLNHPLAGKTLIFDVKIASVE